MFNLKKQANMEQALRRRRKLKTSVKLYKKKNSSGTKSLFLNIWVNGKRQPKEFLNIVLSGSERSKENQDKLLIAEAARSKRENELVVHKIGLPSVHLIKDENTYDFILQKARNLKAKHTTGYLIEYLKEYSGKEVLLLSEIDKQFCLGFQQYLRDNLAQGTAYQMLYHFSSFLNRAYEDELIKENPVRKIPKSERLRPKKSIPEYLTLEEIELLTKKSQKVHREVKLAFLFSCFTGMRYSDLASLRFSQIRKISVGKRDVWMLNFTQVKTEDAAQIPLNDQARQILDECRTLNKKTNDENRLVFPLLSDKYKTISASRSWAGYQLKKWAKHAGLGKRIHFHLGRHTFATLAITYGADLYTTSKLLGHADMKSTQIYAHVLNAPKLAAMDRVSQAVKGMNRKTKRSGK